MQKHFLKGFSLVELSVVLAVIGLLMGMGITVGVSQVESAKVKQTHNKIEAINKAMMAFRVANGRIPCPANLTLGPTHTNSGIEASNPGYCRAGAITANFENGGGVATQGFIVAGAVPIKTLGLPNEFMYDGWGRKFSYAVNVLLTAENGFRDVPLYETCGGLTVHDPSGTKPRTGNSATDGGAAYVLTSHGKNGHGAYYRGAGGWRVNAGSTNAQELENCDCNNAATATAYNAQYVQRTPVELSSSDQFDDIVYFRQRWQMGTDSDVSSPKGVLPNMFAWRNSTTNLPEVYTKSCASIKAGPTPAPFDTTLNLGTSKISPDGRYIFSFQGSVAGGVMYIYKISSTQVLRVDQETLPRGPQIVSFSPDSKYLMLSLDGYTFARIYKNNNDDFTLTYNTDETAFFGADYIQGNISQNGRFFAGGGEWSPIYQNENDVFTLKNLSVNDGGDGTGLSQASALTPDGRYLATAFTNLVAGKYLHLYTRQADGNFNDGTAVATDVPVGTNYLYWDEDGKYLFSINATDARLYKRQGSTLLFIRTFAIANMTGFEGPNNSLLAFDFVTAPCCRINFYRRSGEYLLKEDYVWITPAATFKYISVTR